MVREKGVRGPFAFLWIAVCSWLTGIRGDSHEQGEAGTQPAPTEGLGEFRIPLALYLTRVTPDSRALS